MFCKTRPEARPLRSPKELRPRVTCRCLKSKIIPAYYAYLLINWFNTKIWIKSLCILSLFSFLFNSTSTWFVIRSIRSDVSFWSIFLHLFITTGFILKNDSGYKFIFCSVGSFIFISPLLYVSPTIAFIYSSLFNILNFLLPFSGRKFSNVLITKASLYTVLYEEGCVLLI